MKNYNLAIPCLRGVIGDWVYYSSLLSAEQISSSVSTVKEIREAKSLEEVLQRKLKQRKKAIAKYILDNESKFFNSIILGVFDGVPDWIEFDLSEKFERVLNQDDIENSESSMGIMLFKGTENIFAIDGQHRVEGIKIAFEQEGEKIKDDQYSVIFIAHIDDEQGRIRTRRLFSDINTNAKAVSKGDRVIIDEDDINSIVARKLYSTLEFFKSEGIISVSEQSNLDKEDTTSFTNLIALQSVNKILRKLYHIPSGEKQNKLEHVKGFYVVVKTFYDFIFNKIKDYKSFFKDGTLTLADARNNNSYLLFRPVGLILIAKVYVFYLQKKLTPKDFLEINKLSFVFPESHLNNVLWSTGKMDVRVKNQNLAYNLTLYILGKYPIDKEISLLNTYKEITKNKKATLPLKI